MNRYQFFKFLLTFGCLFSSSLVHALHMNGVDLRDNQAVRVVTAASSFSVVVFMSTRCPCSRSYEATLNRLYKKFSKGKIQFVGILSNAAEARKVGLEHFSAAGLLFPVLHDEDQKILNYFDAYKTPHVFILDVKDRLVYAGPIGDSHIAGHSRTNHLELALEQISKGGDPQPKELRPIGCEIDRID